MEKQLLVQDVLLYKMSGGIGQFNFIVTKCRSALNFTYQLEGEVIEQLELSFEFQFLLYFECLIFPVALLRVLSITFLIIL